MRFKILLFTLFLSFCSVAQETTSDSSTTSTTVNEVSEEPSLESNSVDDESENIDLYEYINHPLNYICDNSCIDNLTDTFVGNVKGELVVLIENEIISDIDYMSDNKILITGHNSGIIYKHEISSNLTTVWFDITSLTIVNGSQETGIHNIEISKNLKNLYISYTNKSNRFIISKFLVVDGVPSLESEIILVNENHISPAHYCGSLFLDEDNERLFGCLGDSQLDQLSLVNWNLHGSIFSIDTNTGDAHILNPKPNEEVEFSKDAVMNRSSFEPDKRILATGFRNPWNFTLSQNKKFLVIPDVGWMDYEELSTYSLDSEFSQFYGWPLVEGPYFRKHFPQILLEYPVTNFFTSEQEVSKEIAFNNSIAPKLYYYHNNGPASIIGGQFISTENSWNEYYVFTDMHKDYFTLVKFNLDGSKVESLFHLKNTIDNQSPVISIEKNYDGDILAVFADGSVYKLIFELN